MTCLCLMGEWLHPHASDCPYPLYGGSAATKAAWTAKRDENRAAMAAGKPPVHRNQARGVTLASMAGR